MYEKYSSSQNYYYTRDVNEILFRQEGTTSLIRYRDWLAFDEEEEEYFQEFYEIGVYGRKIAYLTEYYKFHNDIPRLFMEPLNHIMNYYHDRQRKIKYVKITRMLKRQQQEQGQDQQQDLNENENSGKKPENDRTETQVENSQGELVPATVHSKNKLEGRVSMERLLVPLESFLLNYSMNRKKEEDKQKRNTQNLINSTTQQQSTLLNSSTRTIIDLQNKLNQITHKQHNNFQQDVSTSSICTSYSIQNPNQYSIGNLTNFLKFQDIQHKLSLSKQIKPNNINSNNNNNNNNQPSPSKSTTKQVQQQQQGQRQNNVQVGKNLQLALQQSLAPPIKDAKQLQQQKGIPANYPHSMQNQQSTATSQNLLSSQQSLAIPTSNLQNLIISQQNLISQSSSQNANQSNKQNIVPSLRLPSTSTHVTAKQPSSVIAVLDEQTGLSSKLMSQKISEQTNTQQKDLNYRKTSNPNPYSSNQNNQQFSQKSNQRKDEGNSPQIGGSSLRRQNVSSKILNHNTNTNNSNSGNSTSARMLTETLQQQRIQYTDSGSQSARGDIASLTVKTSIDFKSQKQQQNDQGKKNNRGQVYSSKNANEIALLQQQQQQLGNQQFQFLQNAMANYPDKETLKKLFGNKLKQSSLYLSPEQALQLEQLNNFNEINFNTKIHTHPATTTIDLNQVDYLNINQYDHQLQNPNHLRINAILNSENQTEDQSPHINSSEYFNSFPVSASTQQLPSKNINSKLTLSSTQLLTNPNTPSSNQVLQFQQQSIKSHPSRRTNSIHQPSHNQPTLPTTASSYSATVQGLLQQPPMLAQLGFQIVPQSPKQPSSSPSPLLLLLSQQQQQQQQQYQQQLLLQQQQSCKALSRSHSKQMSPSSPLTGSEQQLSFKFRPQTEHQEQDRRNNIGNGNYDSDHNKKEQNPNQTKQKGQKYPSQPSLPENTSQAVSPSSSNSKGRQKQNQNQFVFNYQSNVNSNNANQMQRMSNELPQSPSIVRQSLPSKTQHSLGRDSSNMRSSNVHINNNIINGNNYNTVNEHHHYINLIETNLFKNDNNIYKNDHVYSNNEINNLKPERKSSGGNLLTEGSKSQKTKEDRMFPKKLHLNLQLLEQQRGSEQLPSCRFDERKKSPDSKKTVATTKNKQQTQPPSSNSLQRKESINSLSNFNSNNPNSNYNTNTNPLNILGNSQPLNIVNNFNGNQVVYSSINSQNNNINLINSNGGNPNKNDSGENFISNYNSNKPSGYSNIKKINNGSSNNYSSNNNSNNKSLQKSQSTHHSRVGSLKGIETVKSIQQPQQQQQQGNNINEIIAGSSSRVSPSINSNKQINLNTVNSPVQLGRYPLVEKPMGQQTSNNNNNSNNNSNQFENVDQQKLQAYNGNTQKSNNSNSNSSNVNAKSQTKQQGGTSVPKDYTSQLQLQQQLQQKQHQHLVQQQQLHQQQQLQLQQQIQLQLQQQMILQQQQFQQQQVYNQHPNLAQLQDGFLTDRTYNTTLSTKKTEVLLTQPSKQSPKHSLIIETLPTQGSGSKRQNIKGHQKTKSDVSGSYQPLYSNQNSKLSNRAGLLGQASTTIARTTTEHSKNSNQNLNLQQQQLQYVKQQAFLQQQQQQRDMSNQQQQQQQQQQMIQEQAALQYQPIKSSRQNSAHQTSSTSMKSNNTPLHSNNNTQPVKDIYFSQLVSSQNSSQGHSRTPSTQKAQPTQQQMSQQLLSSVQINSSKSNGQAPYVQSNNLYYHNTNPTHKQQMLQQQPQLQQIQQQQQQFSSPSQQYQSTLQQAQQFQQQYVQSQQQLNQRKQHSSPRAATTTNNSGNNNLNIKPSESYMVPNQAGINYSEQVFSSMQTRDSSGQSNFHQAYSQRPV